MLTIYKYSLPFKTPFITAAGNYSERTGLLICLKESGLFFWGEAAPLPGFSTESAEDVSFRLQYLKTDITSFFSGSFDLPELTKFVNTTTDAPSLQFALSYLGISLLSHRKRCNMGELFGIQSSKIVYINDVIGHMDSEKWKNAIRESIARGFSCIKIKALYPLDKLALCLDEIHRNNPHVTFRLDANRSWPKDESMLINQSMKHLPVEYIEEPFQDIDLITLTDAQNTFDFPVALDETIQNPENLKAALKRPEQIVIIKPALLGNFCEWVGTIQTYRSSFENIVVTTVLETAIGNSAIADVAGLIGSRIRSHGLNTGKLFRNNLFLIPEFENGKIDMPFLDLRKISPKYLNNEYISLLDS